MAARIPGVTLGGGKLSEFGGSKAAKQYRFWIHPHKGGDNYYYAFPTYAEAAAARPRHRKEGKVEPVLAVVFDKKHRKYREVVVDTKPPRKRSHIDIMKIGIA